MFATAVLTLVTFDLDSSSPTVNFGLYIGYLTPNVGLLLHVLKEREYTLPILNLKLENMRKCLWCRPGEVQPNHGEEQNQNVYPIPLVINVRQLHPLDDGGIFVG